ncbi:MAG: twin-arginine translocase TatA/TatE family subunit [Thermoleophilia bacterium]|nr:twin-arginine translocase TatA/TatE family subunit [Thermoleophilia bacterium]
MPNISWWEILLLVLVILLIFGPKKLPQIGRSMGRGVREFKDTVTDQTKELKEAVGTTPTEFKDGLNPFKSEPEQEESPAAAPATAEREVAVTTQEDVTPARTNGAEPRT